MKESNKVLLTESLASGAKQSPEQSFELGADFNAKSGLADV